MAQEFNIVGNLLLKVDGAEAGLNKLKNSLSKLEIPKGLDNNLKKSFSNLDGIFERFRNQLSKGFDTKTDVSNITKISKELDGELNRMSKSISQLTGEKIDLKVDTEKVKQATQDLELALEKKKELTQQAIDIKVNSSKEGITNIKQLLEEFKRVIGDTKAGKAVGNALFHLDTGDIQKTLSFLKEAEANLGRIGEKKKEAFSSTGFTFQSALELVIKELTTTESEFNVVNGQVKNFQTILSNARGDQLKQVNDILSKVSQGFNETATGARQAAKASEEFGRSTFDAAEQIKQLQQSTQYFFSLRNMINLFKRGVREAVDTVKELDKAMTETAVVTKFDVGDMWAKLPEYTANANALGATVQDMYEATTLYYQQGLNAQQAMSIAAETMKMARIGGLEATKATDMMTAALRGFNMEINETSAQRINDVYSNLAAKTASNTKELGTAMQRTASIAASAGMSFEGTAAFLAQAIETTREPAENLGTAMKTIVARFTELKKNPLEITEVDGEEVSYNKIDTALQSIGVSLKDANGQFRDLDKVFLDISQKWDSLSQTQQRYIATTAAGSRQQSRFIAMMSNYERTVQLMSYANDSAGASNEQFSKTMESLEAKIHKLQNAWKQFLMGIANDKIIKGSVDKLTWGLDKLNTLIDKISGKNAVFKSLLSLFLAFQGLQFAGKGINVLIGKAAGFLPGNTTKIGAEQTGRTGFAGQITTPIVAKLNELIAVIKGEKTSEKAIASTLAGYKNAVNLLRSPQTVGTIQSQFNNLSDEHAYAAFKNSPGTIAAMKQAMVGQLPKEMQTVGGQLMTNIVKGMEKKEISVKKGAELIGKPQLWGKYLGTETAKEFSQQYIASQKGVWVKQTANATKQAWLKAGGSALASDDVIKKYLTTHKDSDVTKAFTSYYKQIRDTMQSVSDVPVDLDKYQQMANTIGMMGSKFTAAGYSIQMFGAQLGQLSPALTKVGNLISRFGSLFMTVGYAVSGFGKTYTAVMARISAATLAYQKVQLYVTGKTARQVFFSELLRGIKPAKMALIGAAIGVALIVAIKNHVEKKAKEAGEEVRNKFEEGFKKTGETLDSLEGSKDRFNELSQGVDRFGHNINLTNEEYDEYLSLTKELSELSPSLIAGYNAEGQAILKKGAALDEVIAKLKEEKQLALESYTTDNSIDKLIGEYKTSDTYKTHKRTVKDTASQFEIIGAFDSELTALSKANSKIADSFTITDAIKQLGGGVVDDLSNLTTEQLLFISQHYNDIINLVKEQNGQLDEEVEEGLRNAFGDIGGAIGDIKTEGAPIIEAMQQWMGLEGLDAAGIKLGEEFSSGFSQGFDAILVDSLSRGDNSEVIKNKLRDYANEWKTLGGATSDYTEILSKADEKQEEYLNHIGEDGAIEQYESDVEGLASELENLADAQNTSTTAGKIFAEQCYQQANALRTFATEGAVPLTQALNTMSDEIASAETALEDFNKVTEKDYWSIAEDMKTIYDKAVETYKDSFGGEYEKHFEGSGDKTVWEAGKALFGEDALEGIDVKQLRKKFKEWEPALREGEEGWYNFWHNITDDSALMESLNKIEGVKWTEDDFFIPDDKWAEVAKTIGISEDLLTAMVNKGRQFADIDFANWSQVRHSFETNKLGIQGASTDVGGKQAIYVKESTFEAALAESGYRPDQYQTQKNNAQAQQNFKFLKDAAEYSGKEGAKELKNIVSDMGIKDLPGLIKTLNDTGDFTRDEIKAYADKLGGDFGVSDEKYDLMYDDIVAAMENPELAKQTSIQQEISNKLSLLTDKRSAKEHTDAYKDFHKQMYGEPGETSAFEHFKKGENSQGKKLSAGEYAETKQIMEDASTDARKMAEKYAGWAETLKGTEDGDIYAKLAEKYQKKADKLDDWIEEGEKLYQENEKIAKEEAKARKSKDTGKEETNKNLAEVKKKQQDEQREKDKERAKHLNDYENKKPATPKTEAEGRKAQDEGRRQSELLKNQKELQEANKQRWDEETKRAQTIAAAEKKATEDKFKKQQDLQKQGELEGQKLKQKYEAEEQARKRKNIEEQSQLEGEKLTERARQEQEAQRKAQLESQDQGRNQQRALSAEQTAVQTDDIQGKTDYLLRTSIDTSLKNALNNLDPTQIASDPAQAQAFSNLYNDLISGTLPSASDLQSLGIFNQLDSQYQDQITGALEEKSSELGEKLSAAYQAFAEADKSAAAYDIAGNDVITKAIKSVGKKLKDWYDKINGINVPENSNNTSTPKQSQESSASINETASVDVSAALANVEQLYNKVTETTDKINEGATFKVTVKDKGLSKAGKNAQKITNASGEQNINVTATTSGLEDVKNLTDAVNDFKDLSNDSVKLSVKVSGVSDVSKAITEVNRFYSLRNDSVTLTTIHEKRATGAHNHGSFSAPSFGSAAGGYGQVGPKGKGGLTLTGELGYEIAWIPSENRSMILGANGPQMVNLPGDAVIWTHEQSKKILKQKSISAGSMDAGGKYKPTRYDNNNTGGNGGSGTPKPSKTDEEIKKKVDAVTAEAGHVVVWWENMARRVESIQRQAEKNQKKLEGLLTKITSTTKTVNGTVKNYQKNLKTSIELNKLEVKKANNELKALDDGSNKYYSQEVVSYEEKVNNEKKSYEMTVDLDRYIKYNELFKNYEIDWQLLEQIGTKKWKDGDGNWHAANKSLAEAIKAAAEKAINDRVSKRNTAEDNITKAQEELEKLSKDIYDTFYGWETSLTKIWNITQKIEALATKISRLDAGTNLLEAQIGSGMRMSDANSAQTDIQLFKQRLDLQNRTLLERQNAITQATQDVKDAVSSQDEQQELDTIKAMLKNPKKYKLNETDILGLKERKKALEEQKKVISKSRKYLKTTKNADGTVNIEFDYEKLREDRLKGEITAEQAEAIEKYKDSIEEANNNLTEQRQALIEGVTEYYSILKDLREQWADYEDQLIQITEENNKKELDQLKTLSDSVKQSLDDLLNDVKRKLDERRKQEDNANTERDISQKQQRLAMLRADTSGGHQVEIAQLEKEIAEAQQNYQRTLEDQLLEKLQNQADEAAKQRERQIELQEKIATSVNNIALVDMWMANPEQYKEEIIQAYKNAQNYDEQGIYRQGVIDTDAEAFFENVRTNQDKQKETLDAIDQSKNLLTQIEEDLKWIGATVENAKGRELNVKDVHEKLGASYKSLRTKGGYTAEDFFDAKVKAKEAKAAGFKLQELKDAGYSAASLKKAGYTAKELKGAGFTIQDLKDIYTPSELKSAGFKLKSFEEAEFDYSSVRDAGFTVNKLRESEVYGEQAEKDYKKIQKRYNTFLITRGAKTKKEAEKAGNAKYWGKLTSNGYNNMVAWGKQLGLTESQVATDLAKTYKLTWKDVIKAAKGAKRSGKTIKKWNPNAKKTSSFYKAFESVFGAGSWKKYASGGLATQTGLAWLDGTPSKPELVLNATDTKNFLALKDVLAGAMKGMSSTSNTYGDILYEININVDKIEKDYDVDRVVEKVKKEITKGAGYRNVTQVRNFR